MGGLTLQHVHPHHSALRACADGIARNTGFQFLDEPDKTARVGLPAIVFLADLGRNTPGILPNDDRPGDRYPGSR